MIEIDWHHHLSDIAKKTNDDDNTHTHKYNKYLHICVDRHDDDDNYRIHFQLSFTVSIINDNDIQVFFLLHNI